MAELKPCPFCGGTNIIYTDKSMEKPNNHSVFCDDCGCGTGFFSGSSPDCILKQYAINAWNRRADNNHAHWIGTEIEGYTGSQPVYSTVACSHCGFENDQEPAYCEQCGYQMDEVIS